MRNLQTLVLSLILGASYGKPLVRIVNGTDAKEGEFPFIVSLQHDGIHICGASIVNDKWVLTAAHCVYGRKPIHFSVIAGTNDLHVGGVHIDVEDAIYHEDYEPVELVNDIAVVKLREPLQFGELVQPVVLPEQGYVTPPGLNATVIGWGRLYTDGPRAKYLQCVVIETYSDEECYKLHKPDHKPNPSNICAGVPGGGKGQCTGDSGGPLVVEDGNYQAGIVSWSVKPCAVAGYPGVYAEVSYYSDWIKSKTA